MKGRFQEVPNGKGTRAPTAKIKPCIIYWSPCHFCCSTLFFHCESCFFYKVEVGVRFQPRFCYSLFFSFCYLQISAVWLKLIILVSLCARPRRRHVRLPLILSGNRLVEHCLLKMRRKLS